MEATQQKAGRHYAWWIMIACGFILFGTLGATSSCIGVFFPPVIGELGVTVAGLSIYISFMTATMALFQPIARKLMTMLDIRVIMSSAIIISCLGFGLMGVYNNLIGFYFSGILIGIGHSFITFQLVPIMITRWFKIKIGFAMGFAVAMSSVGGAILAPICGQLIANFGYRLSYMLIALIGALISLPFSILVLRNDPTSKGLLAYGTEEVAKQESVSVDELASAKGLTFSQASKSPYFFMCILFAFLLSFALNFLVQVTNLAFSYGFPVEKGAIVASVMTIGGIAGSFLIGTLNDKFGIKVALSFGIIMGIIGLGMIASGQATESIVFIAMALFGIATALFSIAPPLVTSGIVGNRDYAKIFSYVASTLTVASTFAGPIYGALYDAAGNYNISVIVVMACLLLALIIGIIGVSNGKKHWA
ncbi:MAG: MFS transporter [Bacillota bacterium]